MVGMSMLLTIVLCVGAFSVIYSRMEPLVRDFGAESTGAEAERVATRTPEPDDAAPTEEAPAENTDAEPAPEPTIEEASSGFDPDYVSNPEEAVNFRSGPTVDSERVAQLAPATPLQYLGDSTDDENGETWLHFVNGDGQEGWIREIDSERSSAHVEPPLFFVTL